MRYFTNFRATLGIQSPSDNGNGTSIRCISEVFGYPLFISWEYDDWCLGILSLTCMIADLQPIIQGCISSPATHMFHDGPLRCRAKFVGSPVSWFGWDPSGMLGPMGVGPIHWVVVVLASFYYRFKWWFRGSGCQHWTPSVEESCEKKRLALTLLQYSFTPLKFNMAPGNDCRVGKGKNVNNLTRPKTTCLKIGRGWCL